MHLTRRQFLGKTATAVLVAGTMATGKVFGANSRIRMCTIGFNGQGGSHIKDILGMKDEAEYVALCDVDSEVLERGAKAVEAAQGKAPKKYKDIRQALEDVYVEKPLSHNIYEGRQLVAAAEKHGRIVQHGTQNRSNSTAIRDMK